MNNFKKLSQKFKKIAATLFSAFTFACTVVGTWFLVATADATTDVATEATEGYVYKHVVIIGVDGAGTFFRNTDTPNIDKIFANGAVSYEATTITPSISAQAWTSMLHGVTPDIHGVNGGNVGSIEFPVDSEYPSVFRVIREQMPNASLASFCNWNPINTAMIENNINVYKATAEDDSAISKSACDYVKEVVANGETAPTLMFIHFDDADHVGHNAGFGSETQLQKISQQDEWIYQVYKTYEDLEILDDTLFILTPDHGGVDYTHGGPLDVEMNIFYAVTGKTVKRGSIGKMDIRDTASIVLYALGLEKYQPTTWTSRVPLGIFKDFDSGERVGYALPDRSHINVDTPTVGSEGHITNFISGKNLKHYLTFDGHIKDEYGAITSQGKKLYFEEGYFGQAVSLEEGYVSIADYATGMDSFTISLWLNTQGVDTESILFSNKDWNTGKNAGFALSLTRSNLQFNVGDDNNQMDMFKQPLANYRTGWTHVTLVVDRIAGEIKIALDFGEFYTEALPDTMKNVSFDAYEVLNIGQDATGVGAGALTALVDEFMVFDGALTSDELGLLAQYYGR